VQRFCDLSQRLREFLTGNVRLRFELRDDLAMTPTALSSSCAALAAAASSAPVNMASLRIFLNVWPNRPLFYGPTNSPASYCYWQSAPQITYALTAPHSDQWERQTEKGAVRIRELILLRLWSVEYGRSKSYI
jgi:hypothetical protein